MDEEWQTWKLLDDLSIEYSSDFVRAANGMVQDWFQHHSLHAIVLHCTPIHRTLLLCNRMKYYSN